MLIPGTMLQGRYRIIRQIGGGGQALVYLAEDANLGGLRAIKELTHDPNASPQERQAAYDQFQREARVLARLNHPNLARVWDHFRIGDNAYLIMDYIDGQTLQEILDQTAGFLPEAAVLRWGGQLCDVLDYLHRQHPPIIFRDLKPSNVMLDRSDTVKLIDFGIVRLFQPGKKTDTLRMGTMGYAPPEQYAGKGQTDARSDIYSLGALLHHLLTKRDPTQYPPFSFNSAPPRSLNPAVSPHVEAAITKALAYDRIHRFQSALEMKQALLEGVQRGLEQRAKPFLLIAVVALLLVLLWAGIRLIISLPTATPTSIPTVTHTPANTPTPSPTTTTDSPTATSTVADIPTATDTPTTEPTATPSPTLQPPTPTATESPTATSTFTPTATPERERIWEKDGSVIVYVPAGEFLMGSKDDPDADGDEHPQHTVYVSEFWIDKTEVTNAQYRKCVQAGTCRAPTTCDWGQPTYSDSSKADHPVVCVSWEDAQAYCEWAGKRLPTEAEWEKAVRGTDGRKYPWGNGFDGSKANFCDVNCEYDWKDSSADDGYQRTAPVGSYPGGASPYGVLDMVGNVWEWCQDWYDEDYYASSPQRDPQGPSSGSYRVARGGSCGNDEGLGRAALRGGFVPDARGYDWGFRCVSQSP